MTSQDVPGVGPISMTIVSRGSRLTIRSLGQTHEVAVPAELRAKQEAWGSFDSLDLTSCVKNVDVAEGRSLNGEPATRIAGEFDALCAFKAVSSVSGLGQNAGSTPTWTSFATTSARRAPPSSFRIGRTCSWAG